MYRKPIHRWDLLANQYPLWRRVRQGPRWSFGSRSQSGQLHTPPEMTNKPALLGELIYWATWMFPTLRSSTVTEMLAEVDENVTAEINNIYWTFNLGSRSLYHIHNFMIADRLKDFRVLISETGFPVNTSQFNTEQFHLCGQFPGMPPAGVKSRVKCPWGGITGRYVYITLPRIAVLTMCEVEIYGRKWAMDQTHQNLYSKSNIM